MPIPAFRRCVPTPHCGGVTEPLTLIALGTVAVGIGVVIVELRRLLARIDALGHQLQENTAANDQIGALAQQISAAERAAVNAEETSRTVSRQLIELSKVTVDQAVILVEIRDDLMKKLPGPDGGRRALRHAESTGGTA
jgi:hypothetical protein